jgi:hypothetical protein
MLVQPELQGILVEGEERAIGTGDWKQELGSSMGGWE